MTPSNAKDNDIRQALSSLIPSGWLELKARQVNFVRRIRKVEVWPFVWTLVLGINASGERSIAALRRLFGNETGVLLVPSSFYDRFTPALTQLMRELLLYAMERMCEPVRALKGRLKAFKDVLAMDATIVRLHDNLAKDFPASRSHLIASAAKVNVVMSVVGQGPRTVKVMAERSKEERKVALGPWIRNRLLLFDLGYYSGRLFSNIDKHEGYFISRMKSNMNPVVTEVYLAEGAKAPQAGESLLVILKGFEGTALDLRARIRFKRRGYASHQRWDEMEFRVVALWNPEIEEWRCYITNVPRTLLNAEEIGKVYGLRWEIEIVFRQLKECFRLGEFPTEKAHIVEALIYAAILTLVASRRLLMMMRKRYAHEADRMPAERWSRVMTSASHELMEEIIPRKPRDPRKTRALLAFLHREMIDPNKNRAGGLLGRIEGEDKPLDLNILRELYNDISGHLNT